MSFDDISPLFTRPDGTYLFARWGRPIVPVVFGVDDASLAVIKGAIEVVVAMAGHRMAAQDAELGANLLLFFCKAWQDLAQVPNLGALVPDAPDLLARLAASGANQYRSFRHDEAGAIKAAVVFVRLDEALAAMATEDLALLQAVRVICQWSEGAFANRAPLAAISGRAVLRPDVAAVIRAAYDPVLPSASRDAAHAYRLAARVGK